MTLIAKEGGAKREPIPAGSYIARCVSIVDLGQQYSKQYDKWYPKVLIQWELPDFTYQTTEGVTKAKVIGEMYSLGLNEKSTLRKILEAWRGKAFTQEELDGFDVSKLLDVACAITIVHNISDKGTYENVSSVTLPLKGTAIPDRINDLMLFNLDTPGAMNEVDKLPEWIAKKIKDSKEYIERDIALANDEADLPDESLPF